MPGDCGGGIMIVDTCGAGFKGGLWRSWGLERTKRGTQALQLQT